MLHGAQDRAVQSAHLQAREAEEKHYAGTLRGNTQGSDAACGETPPATEWLTRDLSHIFKEQQQALSILGDLYIKLTGEKPPGYPIHGSNTKDGPSSGLFRELAISMNALRDQSGAIVNLALTINRAI
jgi:hypothetical protein